MKEFYNTTNEIGTQLQIFTDKAITQEDKIMVIFKQYYRLTAYECYQYYLLKHEVNTPLTSIRRAITNLTNKDKLVNVGNCYKELKMSNQIIFNNF